MPPASLFLATAGAFEVELEPYADSVESSGRTPLPAGPSTSTKRTSNTLSSLTAPSVLADIDKNGHPSSRASSSPSAVPTATSPSRSALLATSTRGTDSAQTVSNSMSLMWETCTNTSGLQVGGQFVHGWTANSQAIDPEIRDLGHHVYFH